MTLNLYIFLLRHARKYISTRFEVHNRWSLELPWLFCTCGAERDGHTDGRMDGIISQYMKLHKICRIHAMCPSVYRLFAPQLCSRCIGPVNAHELVMYARQQIYHVDCFVCAVCERRLATGEHFGMHRNAIYCQVSVALSQLTDARVTRARIKGGYGINLPEMLTSKIFNTYLCSRSCQNCYYYFKQKYCIFFSLKRSMTLKCAKRRLRPGLRLGPAAGGAHDVSRPSSWLGRGTPVPNRHPIRRLRRLITVNLLRFYFLHAALRACVLNITVTVLQ